MVTTVAPASPSLPPAPAPSPVAANGAQPQSSQFKDVYKTSQQNQENADPKSKGDTGKDNGLKKEDAGSEANKSGAIVNLSPTVVPLQKVPLLFALPSLGLHMAGETTGSEESQDSSEGPAQPEAAALLHGGAPPAAASTRIAPAPSAGSLAFAVQLGSVAAPVSKTIPAAAPKLTAANPVPAQASGPKPQFSQAALAGAQSKQQDTSDADRRSPAVEPAAPIHEAAPATAFEAAASAQAADFSEPSARTIATPAVHDAQPVAQEPNRVTPPANTEILLHLTAGKDQPNAAVRVVDRAGTVNVSVHAADPDLRSSLRSNLNDLASQLSGQGFKTELVKPAVIAARMENGQDSRHDEQQRSGGNAHHYTPGQRQPQRDRDAKSDRWLAELDEEFSGNSRNQGGSN